MQDKELYQHILGLTAPWTVSEVKLDMDSQEIRVRVQHPLGTKFCCPECQKEPACYDHGEERQWRHLDSCHFKTILLARVPRVQCQEHGVKSVSVPWAEPHSRFTMLFERFAIEVLQMTQTVIRTKMAPMKKLAKSLKERIDNIDNLKKAILFYCGGLDLYPR